MPNHKTDYRRYFQIGGITIQVESEIPITDSTFQSKFKHFEADGPGKDNIIIKHYFSIPSLKTFDLGNEVYRKPPWEIYRKDDTWVYLRRSQGKLIQRVYQLTIFNKDHTNAQIYNRSKQLFHKGNLHNITMFATDQVLLAQVLSDREACIMHSAGIKMNGNGFLFVGHSDAGKSTIVSMMKDKSTILCDDRIIVRKWNEKFKIHGTWSHGDVPEISSGSAPLHSIMFLEHAPENQLIQLKDKKIVIEKLTACLIKPFVTAKWWNDMLTLIEQITCEIPCYVLKFKKDDTVLNLLYQL